MGELLAGEEYLRALVAALPDLAFCLDREGTHLSFHAPRAESLFVEPESILGRKVGELLPEDVAEAYLASIASTLDGGERVEFEYKLAFAEDDLRHYEARMVPHSEEVVLVLVRDVTELRSAAAARLELERQVRHFQGLESVGTLAAGVAHDLNNFLGIVMSLGEYLIQRSSNPAEVTRHARQIVEQCRRGANVARRLLALGRVEELPEELVEPVALLRDVTTLIRSAAPRNIEVFQVGAAGGAGFRGHRDQLVSVLVNLCVNAMDAMPEGGRLTLRVELESREGANDEVRITVEDTGVGMDRETLERATQEFFTTKPSGRGSGLGLPIAARTLQDHGGRLEVESEVGRGARVSLVLPARASG